MILSVYRPGPLSMSPGPGGGGSGVPSPPNANLIDPSGGGSGGGSGVPSPPKARVFFFGEFPRFFLDTGLPDFPPPDFRPPPPRFAVFFRAELARRADFLAAGFLRADRFALVFLRPDFFAADFRRVDFFAAPRFAVPLRAVFLRPPFRAAIGVSPRLKIYFPATAFSPRIVASRSLKRDASTELSSRTAASILSWRLAGTYSM